MIGPELEPEPELDLAARATTAAAGLSTPSAIARSRQGRHDTPRDPAHAAAERLAAEFQAPVGLIDLHAAAWAARVGSPPRGFPEVDAALSAALSSGVHWHGRVALWRADREALALPVSAAAAASVWLLIPVPGPEGDPWLGVVGFAPTGGPSAAAAGDVEGLGPPCPDRALRAWGQSVADDLRGEAFPRAPRATPNPAAGSERLLTARLIRRMRISDAPEAFQELALRAAREALGVAAVAWVPSSTTEPVVVAGGLESLRRDEIRALVPPGLEGTVHVVNHPHAGDPGRQVRFAVVASEAKAASGWVVAINPPSGAEFSAAQVELLQPLASLLGAQRNNARLYRDLKEMLFGIIRALTAAIDAKDPYTSGHSERVARIAVRLAEELGMPVNQRGDLYLMGLLHDVGKIGVEDGVLKKTGPLTPEEYSRIQDHVMIGVNILSDLKKLHHLLPGVASHHEAYDGTGYPRGLAGEAIPLAARILAVADSYDAMSSTRPYRRSLSPQKIDEIFQRGSGGQWDPSIVAALFACRGDLEQIRQKGLGVSLVAAVDDMVNKFT